MAVNGNIETTIQVRIQNHHCKVYLFHSSIHLTFVANMFAFFRLDIEYFQSYCFICYIVFVYASPLSERFPFSVQSLIFTPISRSTWGSMRGTARGAQGGVPVWLGGICGLIHGVNQAGSLTCYPDPRFRIPVRFLFPQGNGDPRSADHP